MAIPEPLSHVEIGLLKIPYINFNKILTFQRWNLLRIILSWLDLEGTYEIYSFALSLKLENGGAEQLWLFWNGSAKKLHWN
jgi:hypothetical protein